MSTDAWSDEFEIVVDDSPSPRMASRTVVARMHDIDVPMAEIKRRIHEAVGDSQPYTFSSSRSERAWGDLKASTSMRFTFDERVLAGAGIDVLTRLLLQLGHGTSSTPDRHMTEEEAVVCAAWHVRTHRGVELGDYAAVASDGDGGGSWQIELSAAGRSHEVVFLDGSGDIFVVTTTASER